MVKISSGVDRESEKNSSEKFRSIVKKYATSDVLYKLGELLETS